MGQWLGIGGAPWRGWGVTSPPFASRGGGLSPPRCQSVPFHLFSAFASCCAELYCWSCAPSFALQTVADAKHASKKHALIIKRLGFEVQFKQYRISNMVWSVHIPRLFALSLTRNRAPEGAFALRTDTRHLDNADTTKGSQRAHT